MNTCWELDGQPFVLDLCFVMSVSSQPFRNELPCRQRRLGRGTMTERSNGPAEPLKRAPTLAARYHRLYIDQGRKICADRYRVDPATRAARRNPTTSKKPKRVGQDKKKSQSAPVTSPPQPQPTKAA